MKQMNYTRGALLAGFLGLAAAMNFLSPMPTGAVGASPVGRRAPYELVVTLSSRDLPRAFVHTMSLTRGQYEDVRFSPRKMRKKAIKKAQAALAKKLGLNTVSQGSGARLQNATVVDVEVVDTKRENRRDGRVSILRADSLS